jgi:hypothetical protein
VQPLAKPLEKPLTKPLPKQSSGGAPSLIYTARAVKDEDRCVLQRIHIYIHVYMYIMNVTSVWLIARSSLNLTFVCLDGYMVLAHLDAARDSED